MAAFLIDTVLDEQTNIVGPSSCTETVEQIKKGKRFRCLCGDNEQLCTGYFLGDSDSEEGFLPLECYAEPALGAVSIQYKENRKWETL